MPPSSPLGLSSRRQVIVKGGSFLSRALNNQIETTLVMTWGWDQWGLGGGRRGKQASPLMKMVMMVLLSSIEIETTLLMTGGGVLEGGKGNQALPLMPRCSRKSRHCDNMSHDCAPARKFLTTPKTVALCIWDWPVNWCHCIVVYCST